MLYNCLHNSACMSMCHFGERSMTLTIIVQRSVGPLGGDTSLQKHQLLQGDPSKYKVWNARSNIYLVI